MPKWFLYSRAFMRIVLRVMRSREVVSLVTADGKKFEELLPFDARADASSDLPSSVMA